MSCDGAEKIPQLGSGLLRSREPLPFSLQHTPADFVPQCRKILLHPASEWRNGSSVSGHPLHAHWDASASRKALPH